MIKKEELMLTKDWDKTFAKSDKVNHKKVTFVNRYGITLAGDLYTPKMQKASWPRLLFPAPLVRLKSSPLACMLKRWQSVGF